MHRAEIRVDAPSAAVAEAVAGAIGPELADVPGRAALQVAGSAVTFQLDADDLPSLRAMVHTVLRLADAAIGTARQAARRQDI
jgi:tRNA threonylcarbamoyladenosine modification (KEOPS) complex  Pcc1 subunit